MKLRRDAGRDVFAELERARRVGLPKAKRAEAQLRTLVAKLPRGYFDVGLALAAFRENRHALFLGHRTFEGYLGASGILRRATAYKLLSIAKHLPRTRADALGLERAYALSRIAARGGRAGTAKGLDALSSRELLRRNRSAPPVSDAARELVEQLVGRGFRSAKAQTLDGRTVIVLSLVDAKKIL
ncbi:hypothetical protein BH09MYX1_BH09MYX1_23330 [soil metagenome]